MVRSFKTSELTRPDILACKTWRAKLNCSDDSCACGQSKNSQCSEKGINSRVCSCKPGYSGFSGPFANETFLLVDDSNPYLNDCVGMLPKDYVLRFFQSPKAAVFEVKQTLLIAA